MIGQKVWCLYKLEHSMYGFTTQLINIFAYEKDANAQILALKSADENPAEGDDYGLYSGTTYEVVETEIR